jgi:hypothetical protein
VSGDQRRTAAMAQQIAKHRVKNQTEVAALRKKGVYR